jgi:predicted MFS family arabinose efflux permease
VNLTDWTGILIIGMILMTLGEMIASPFSSALALQMAPKGRKGSYMALFSIIFSISHIFGHSDGMNLVDQFGFELTWYVMTIIIIFVSALTYWLYYLMKKSPTFTSY